MTRIGFVQTVDDVLNLTDYEMKYIDAETKEGEDFANDEILFAFAKEWVMRGLGPGYENIY